MLLVLGEEAVPVNISNFVIHDLKIGYYVACIYDFDWYAGITLDISIDNGDIYVKFMHPKGPEVFNEMEMEINIITLTKKIVRFYCELAAG